MQENHQSKLQEINDSILPADKAAWQAARDRWNAVAKPIGSLGALERKVERIAALIGTPDVDISKRCVVVLCSDNGVCEEGISQSPIEITTIIAGSVAKGISSVCKLCAPAGIDSFSVDVGMIEPSSVEGVIDRNIARGTCNISRGPAMTEDQAMQAIFTGIDLVGEFKDMGYGLIATGEMGIGNTTTTSAMTAAFLGMPVEDVTGRGSGLSNEGLQRKIAVIKKALEVNQPDAADPLDVLSKLGGFDIASMAGMFIGGAVHRVPMVIDGFISVLAAYTASMLCPACKCAMVSSHVSAEPAAIRIVEALELEPAINAGMRLGEGSGAVCLVPMLDMAISLYNGTTFDQSGIEAYEVGLSER